MLLRLPIPDSIYHWDTAIGSIVSESAAYPSDLNILATELTFISSSFVSSLLDKSIQSLYGIVIILVLQIYLYISLKALFIILSRVASSNSKSKINPVNSNLIWSL